MDDKTMLEKVPMNTKTLKVSALRRNAGFTAIEIAMVAAVIAILSLIILPVFRSKVEEAKIAAAQADLAALMKAEQVVKADIDAYARLEDLDNVKLYGYMGAPPLGITNQVPAFKYVNPSSAISPDPNSRQIISLPAERALLAGSETNPVWKGPYIAFQRHEKYVNIANTVLTPVSAYLLRSAGGDYRSAIQDLPNGGPTPYYDADENRIPLDPWGIPYLFFPPTGNSADATASNGASPSAVIYSMGPNMQPGDGSQAGNPAAYRREFALQNPTDLGRLGADDDLMVEF